MGIKLPMNSNTFTTTNLFGHLGKVLISLGDSGSNVVSASVGSSPSDFATNIANAHSTLSAYPIDVDMDKIADTILIANSTYDFSVEDGIFVKTYKVHRNASNGANIAIRDTNGSTYETIHLSSSQLTGREIANVINSSSSYFDANGTDGYLFVATNNSKYKNFYLEQVDSNDTRLELTTDYIDVNSSGTISSIYTVDDLVKTKVDMNSSGRVATYIRPENYKDDKIRNSHDVTLSLSTLAGDSLYLKFGMLTECNSSNDIANNGLYSFTSHDGMTVALDWRYSGGTSYVDVCIPFLEVNQTYDNNRPDRFFSAVAEGMNKYFNEINTTLLEMRASSDNGSIYFTGTFSVNYIYANSYHYLELNDSTSSLDEVVSKESNMSYIPYSFSNLESNGIYPGGITRDLDNPIVLLQRLTGYKAKKILTTSEDADGDSFSWKFIDLTKDYSNWFNPADSYNLFTFDKTKGYWVLLEDIDQNYFGNFQAGTDSPNLSVNIVYNHSFVNWTGDI
ncbi:MAG TPA: hypothetical protein EYO61_00725, partial [Campylobacterales bacterium]|nr:hypothetical protein [Campylobacterales bacterium]